MTATALAALFRAAGERARRSRFRPPPRYSVRRSGGLAWVRDAPGAHSWTSRPNGGCPTRLRPVATGWAVDLLPLFPRRRGPNPPASIPAGVFPTLAWALHSVAPGAAHRFERPAE